jgi:NAD+ kinase
MVFNRSLVVSGDEGVGVRVLDSSGPVAVSVDGQLRGVIGPGDWIDVHVAASSARLVRLRPPRFYDRLRHRFALAAAPAIGPDGAPQTLIDPPDEQ